MHRYNKLFKTTLIMGAGLSGIITYYKMKKIHNMSDHVYARINDFNKLPDIVQQIILNDFNDPNIDLVREQIEQRLDGLDRVKYPSDRLDIEYLEDIQSFFSS